MDTADVDQIGSGLWVNGEEKRIHRKGFRAFQNEIMALTLY